MIEQIMYYRNTGELKFCFIRTQLPTQIYSFVTVQQSNDYQAEQYYRDEMTKRLKQIGLWLLLCLTCIDLIHAQAKPDTTLRSGTGIQPRFQLKTNLLYLAALMLNLEGEYYIGKSFSVNMESQFAWWSIPKKHDYYRIFTLSPEIRYWIKARRPLQGHFIGAFGGIGLYDLMAGPPRGLQGELIAYGLTYGFCFRLTKRLNMEIAVSAGYASTTYDQYYPDEGCYVYEMTKRKTYIGPTKLKVSLVWPLTYRFAKKRRNNARKKKVDMATDITLDTDGMRTKQTVL